MKSPVVKRSVVLAPVSLRMLARLERYRHEPPDYAVRFDQQDRD